MKYLVVFKTYQGKYYTGQYTRVYDTYEEMLEAIHQVSYHMEVEAVYTIGEKLDLEVLK